jgi:signal transduction histidine kinase
LVTGVVLTRVVAVALNPLVRMTSLAHHIVAGARGRRLRPTKPETDLGRTAVALDEMLDALESAESSAQQAEDRMRQFLADASHDLRTPLAGVIAGSDAMLRADFAGLERIDCEQRLVAIVRQARRAARLVDDLLIMSRLDAQQRPAQTVELVDIVRQQVETVAVRRPDVVRTVCADLPRHFVQVDPDDLRRAISNLLDNAADASPPNGRLSVEIAAAGGQVAIMIADEGPGVPAGEQDRIFDRFVRLSKERSGTGTGLGLPIARAIVRRNGGDIVCVPASSGVRGRFVLTLPVESTPDRTGESLSGQFLHAAERPMDRAAFR